MSKTLILLEMDDLRSELVEVLKSELPDLLNGLLLAIKPPSTELVTRKEAALFFGVSLPTIDDWIHTGQIPAYRIGNCIRLKKDELIEAMSKIKGIE
jgi:excisionase family DNA binding protein